MQKVAADFALHTAGDLLALSGGEVLVGRSREDTVAMRRIAQWAGSIYAAYAGAFGEAEGLTPEGN